MRAIYKGSGDLLLSNLLKPFYAANLQAHTQSILVCLNTPWLSCQMAFPLRTRLRYR